MKNLTKHFVVMVCTLFLCGAMHATFAQKKTKTTKKVAKTAPAEVKFLAKGDGIESCVVSGEKLENKNISAEIFGRTVYFCCNDCKAAAVKNPAAYVKKTEAAQIAAIQALAKGNSHADHHHNEPAKNNSVAFLGKGDGVESCPVTGEPIDKSISVEIQGKTVYTCCASCLSKVKENPAAYLKWAAQQ